MEKIDYTTTLQKINSKKAKIALEFFFLCCYAEQVHKMKTTSPLYFLYVVPQQ